MKIKKEQIKLINLWYIVQAFIRSLIKRNHIAEQVEYRKKLIGESHPECLTTGECYCGCDTEDMIWSDKECEKKCYPPFKNKFQWNLQKIQQGL